MSRAFKLSGRYPERDIASSEGIAERALCPLYPFDSDSETIELAFGIRIERAPTSFKESLSGHCLGLHSFWDEDIKIKNAWVASLPYLDKTVDIDTTEPKQQDVPGLLESLFAGRTQELVFRLITGLRLYREGLVTPGPIALPTFKGKEPMWLTPSWLDIRGEDYSFEEPKTFTLRLVDVPAIDSILQDIARWQVKELPRNMDVAFTRFHAGYGGEPEERIIDQMIAFEAIFLEAGQELQYRLALRVACLIGEDAKMKSSIFKDMRDAYGLRSKIVHGSTSVDRRKLERILPRTEEYLRKSIRKFLSLLSQGYEFKQIRGQLLDQRILDSDMHL